VLPDYFLSEPGIQPDVLTPDRLQRISSEGSSDSPLSVEYRTSGSAAEQSVGVRPKFSLPLSRLFISRNSDRQPCPDASESSITSTAQGVKGFLARLIPNALPTMVSGMRSNVVVPQQEATALRWTDSRDSLVENQQQALQLANDRTPKDASDMDSCGSIPRRVDLLFAACAEQDRSQVPSLGGHQEASPFRARLPPPSVCTIEAHCKDEEAACSLVGSVVDHAFAENKLCTSPSREHPGSDRLDMVHKLAQEQSSECSPDIDSCGSAQRRVDMRFASAKWDCSPPCFPEGHQEASPACSHISSPPVGTHEPRNWSSRAAGDMLGSVSDQATAASQCWTSPPSKEDPAVGQGMAYALQQGDSQEKESSMDACSSVRRRVDLLDSACEDLRSPFPQAQHENVACSPLASPSRVTHGPGTSEAAPDCADPFVDQQSTEDKCLSIHSHFHNPLWSRGGQKSALLPGTSLPSSIPQTTGLLPTHQAPSHLANDCNTHEMDRHRSPQAPNQDINPSAVVCQVDGDKSGHSAVLGLSQDGASLPGDTATKGFAAASCRSPQCDGTEMLKVVDGALDIKPKSTEYQDSSSPERQLRFLHVEAEECDNGDRNRRASHDREASGQPSPIVTALSTSDTLVCILQHAWILHHETCLHSQRP
jgi:hypothetical protein